MAPSLGGHLPFLRPRRDGRMASRVRSSSAGVCGKAALVGRHELGRYDACLGCRAVALCSVLCVGARLCARQRVARCEFQFCVRVCVLCVDVQSLAWGAPTITMWAGGPCTSYCRAVTPLPPRCPAGTHPTSSQRTPVADFGAWCVAALAAAGVGRGGAGESHGSKSLPLG